MCPAASLMRNKNRYCTVSKGVICIWVGFFQGTQGSADTWAQEVTLDLTPCFKWPQINTFVWYLYLKKLHFGSYGYSLSSAFTKRKSYSLTEWLIKTKIFFLFSYYVYSHCNLTGMKHESALIYFFDILNRHWCLQKFKIRWKLTQM